jgi:serine/threonine protein phosphatase PrpC
MGVEALDACDRAPLFVAADMSEAELHELAGGAAAVFSRRCPGKPTPNEDAAALLPFGRSAAALVVADGVGGERAGGQASSAALRAFKQSLRKAEREESLMRTAILDGFESANHAVRDLGVGGATTLAVAEINDGVVRSYHVGDSMILQVGQRGRIKHQTISHSPVGFALESGMIDEHEAMHHEERHLVSNVLGGPDMRIELGPPTRLAPRDTLLLASDGLFDNLDRDQIVAIIRKGPIDRAARQLVDQATQRMLDPGEGQPSKPDDLTFIAFRRVAAR